MLEENDDNNIAAIYSVHHCVPPKCTRMVFVHTVCTEVHRIGGRKCKEDNIAETNDLEAAHRSTEEALTVAMQGELEGSICICINLKIYFSKFKKFICIDLKIYFCSSEYGGGSDCCHAGRVGRKNLSSKITKIQIIQIQI